MYEIFIKLSNIFTVILKKKKNNNYIRGSYLMPFDGVLFNTNKLSSGQNNHKTFILIIIKTFCRMQAC